MTGSIGAQITSWTEPLIRVVVPDNVLSGSIVTVRTQTGASVSSNPITIIRNQPLPSPITGGGLPRGGLLGAPGGYILNGLFPPETPSPSRTITSIKINGTEVDLSTSNPQLRLHLPGTEGVGGPVIVPVEITYDEIAADGSRQSNTYPTYLAFNYLNDFTQIELPSNFSQNSNSPAPAPSLPPNTPRCGLSANDVSTNITIAIGNYITFKLNNIPDGAVSASWFGSGGSVPSAIADFQRGAAGIWSKIYGPYGADTVGNYSRQVVVYDGAGTAICQSNLVNISVLASFQPRGQCTAIGSRCGPSYPACCTNPPSSCSATTGNCQLNYSVATPYPVGVIATPTPIPLTAPNNCHPGLIGCRNSFDCGTGNCGLSCIIGGGPNNTNVCR